MPECPRCDREVDSLRVIPPDAMTRELADTIDHVEDSDPTKGDVEVCTECADGLLGE